MTSRTATLALTMTVLTAGVLGYLAGTASDSEASIYKPAAYSTIEKNQAWPLKGNITMKPCAVQVCQEV